MSEYSPSAATRLALINAAGVLFAEYGIDSVTTRDIAEAANENKGSIHYHFGGKDGLLTAVLDYAAQPWKDDPMGRHLQENEGLIETQDGQDRLLGELVDLFFDTISAKDYPPWCKTLVFRVLQKENGVSAQVFSTCVSPSIGSFIKLYAKITGDDDFTRAYAWAESIVSPIILHAINPNVSGHFFKDGKTPSNYLDLLKDISKAGAMTWLRRMNAKRNGVGK